MLGSITPLGERGRGSRWGVTVSAYLVGSAAGGAALGATLGALGEPLSLSSTERLVILAGAIVIGVAFDLGAGGLTLPTTRRQVDEHWRAEYRGWVWGLTFGLARALPILSVARVRTSGQLLGIDRTVQRLATPARRATIAASASIAAIAIAGVAR